MLDVGWIEGNFELEPPEPNFNFCVDYVRLKDFPEELGEENIFAQLCGDQGESKTGQFSGLPIEVRKGMLAAQGDGERRVSWEVFTYMGKSRGR